MTSFDQAFNYLLTKEGYNYTNDPNDKGGPTRFGITKATLETYLKREVTPAEVAALDLSTAKLIYEQFYWEPMGCPKMSNIGISICLFSTCVLYGIHKTSELTQLALNSFGNSLKIDGVLGDKSISLLNIVKQDEFLQAFHVQVLNRIEEIIASNPTQKKYENGWKNRANSLLDLRLVKTTIV